MPKTSFLSTLEAFAKAHTGHPRVGYLNDTIRILFNKDLSDAITRSVASGDSKALAFVVPLPPRCKWRRRLLIRKAVWVIEDDGTA